MNLQSPLPFQAFSTRTGLYTSDANSRIYNVPPSQGLGDLIADGCIPLSHDPVSCFRNLLDGGDFTVNPWQRGSTFTGITNTATYTADRWFAIGGASSSISVSNVATSAVAGFANALQFGRASANANTAPIYVGQVLETADSVRAQGQYVTVSFWALAGANFSGAALTVALEYGTGANQSAANLAAGSWTGQAYPALIPASANGTAGTAGAYGVGTPASQPLTAGAVRYSFTAFIPTTATQIGLLIGYTPGGTAGAADWVQIIGAQLEIGASASVFEHRDIQVELEIAQRYCWVTPEPAANTITAVGYCSGTNAQLFYMATPVQMRATPTVVVTAGTFKVHTNGSPVSPGALTGVGQVNAITVQATAVSGAQGQGAALVGGGGAGAIVVSADL